MNRCDAMMDELKAYVDGELPPRRRAAIGLHLARCRGCREEAQAMEMVTVDLRAGESGGMTPELRRLLLSAAPVTVESDPAALSPIRRRITFVEALAVLGIVSVVTAMLFPVFARSRE